MRLLDSCERGLWKSFPKSNPTLKSQGRQDFPLGRKRPFLVLDLVLSMMFLFIYTNLVNVGEKNGTFWKLLLLSSFYYYYTVYSLDRLLFFLLLCFEPMFTGVFIVLHCFNLFNFQPSRLCDLTPLVSNDKACLGLIALTLLSMLDFFPFYYHSLSSASDHEVGKHKRLELSMSLSLGTHKATFKGQAYRQ